MKGPGDSSLVIIVLYLSSYQIEGLPYKRLERENIAHD